MHAEGLHLEVSRVGGDGEDTEGVGVAKTTLPALNGDDGRAGLDDVELEGAAETEADTVVDIDLPLVALDAPGLGIPERINAPVEVDLTRSLLVAGN